MLLGQTVMAPTAGATYYGPWMPRRGNGFLAVLQVFLASSTSNTYTVKVEVQTKNAEDVDPTTALTGSITVNDVGVEEALFSGCLELVRYKYTLTGVSLDRWVHLRMNPPIWQPN